MRFQIWKECECMKKKKKNTSSNALIFLITWELRDEAFESYIFMLKTFQLNYNTLHTWKNLSTPKKKKNTNTSK